MRRFNDPEMQIMRFDLQDILTASGETYRPNEPELPPDDFLAEQG